MIAQTHQTEGLTRVNEDARGGPSSSGGTILAGAVPPGTSSDMGGVGKIALTPPAPPGEAEKGKPRRSRRFHVPKLGGADRERHDFLLSQLLDYGRSRGAAEEALAVAWVVRGERVPYPNQLPELNNLARRLEAPGIRGSDHSEA